MTPLLSVRDLTTAFAGHVVVDCVSFDLAPGEILGLVGESGCGKSVTALSILRLIDPPGRIVGGQVLFEGEDLAAARAARLRQIRGDRIGMVFQEPMSALNPVFTIGDQVAETLRHHRGLGQDEAWRRAVELLERVEIPAPARRAQDYPHRLSGGMRQRVMIAMALACEPRLLILDEPTTALDVTIQAQILDLLRGLQRELRMAVLLITHDLGVVAEFAQRVIVMYAGRVVEEAPTATIFEQPLHPYTAALLASIPPITGPRTRLTAIEGTVPGPQERLTGCRFRPRCRHAMPACAEIDPPLTVPAQGRRVACLRCAA